MKTMRAFHILKNSNISQHNASFSFQTVTTVDQLYDKVQGLNANKVPG